MLDQRRLLPDLLERQVLRFHRLLPFRYDLYSRPSMHNVRVQRRLLSIWYLGLERLFDGLLSFRPIGIEWCLRLPSGSAEIVLRFDQVSVCASGMSYCISKCCPTGSSEVSGDCVCDSKEQTLNSGGTACVSRCSSGWTYYNTVCCPSGSTETSKGVCSCTGTQ